ncbi:hypothetical protein JMJ56_32810 [Belnapia sp. T18]|uniref:DUF222 domain-containing protein n=1 Tax=Belnapia arida TaxID=2804533 RepID=A0ABS1UDH1_9PROT|nr:hypothetical protein [Belnapia arida]MBL6082741.1 hypothetical protein [Belnapia arida]
MTDDILAEAEQLVDLGPVEAAQAILAEHQALLSDARQVAARANAALQVARAELERLVDRAFSGQVVTSEQVAAAHAAALDGERYATFLGAVARRFEEPVAAARAALADALHTAWLPVLRRGQDRRISAAARADRARMMGSVTSSTFPDDKRRILEARKLAFDLAEPEFGRGTALIDMAADHGARLDMALRVGKPTWPSSEDRERRYWGRPLSLDDLTDAA